MKYTTYPDPGLNDGEFDEHEKLISSQLLLLEQIQVDLWGDPINEGQILKPSDPSLMINWIGGGFFQYDWEGKCITATFALSLPDGDEGTDEDDMGYSGLGLEYFIEAPHGQEWPLQLLYNVVQSVFDEEGGVLEPGMYIKWDSGFVPPEENKDRISLLCVKKHDVEIPAGSFEVCKFVPLTEEELDEYIALGEDKSEQSEVWYKAKGLDEAVMISLSN